MWSNVDESSYDTMFDLMYLGVYSERLAETKSRRKVLAGLSY